MKQMQYEAFVGLVNMIEMIHILFWFLHISLMMKSWNTCKFLFSCSNLQIILNILLFSCFMWANDGDDGELTRVEPWRDGRIKTMAWSWNDDWRWIRVKHGVIFAFVTIFVTCRNFSSNLIYTKRSLYQIEVVSSSNCTKFKFVSNNLYQVEVESNGNCNKLNVIIGFK